MRDRSLQEEKNPQKENVNKNAKLLKQSKLQLRLELRRELEQRVKIKLKKKVMDPLKDILRIMFKDKTI